MHHKWYDTHNDKVRCSWNFNEKCGSSKKTETFWFSSCECEDLWKWVTSKRNWAQPSAKTLGSAHKFIFETPN